MGMYDSVLVSCPSCGQEVTFQSKAGDCKLDEFVLSNTPLEILGDIKTSEEVCTCGAVIGIQTTAIAIAYRKR